MEKDNILFFYCSRLTRTVLALTDWKGAIPNFTILQQMQVISKQLNSKAGATCRIYCCVPELLQFCIEPSFYKHITNRRLHVWPLSINTSRTLCHTVSVQRRFSLLKAISRLLSRTWIAQSVNDEVNPSQPSDVMWRHTLHLSLICMSFAQWFQ
jgi:hypothetical protein